MKKSSSFGPHLVSLLLSAAGAIAGGFFALVILGVGRLFGGVAELASGARHIGRLIQCPRGCPPQAADGWWQCARCRGTFAGFVWDKCPGCSHVAGQTECRACGHLIVNPFFRSEGW